MEDCFIEGEGYAMDLRGDNLVVVRNADQEIGVYPGAAIRLRATNLLARDHVVRFDRAVDDLGFVKALLAAEPEAEALAKAHQLDRNPLYWVGLLRHTKAEIRATAAERVEAMLGLKVHLPGPDPADPEDINKAIVELDDASFAVRKAAQARLETFAWDAEAALRKIAKTGTPEQRLRAEQILKKTPPGECAVDVECGRLLNWIEARRDRLVWDEENKTYK